MNGLSNAADGLFPAEGILELLLVSLGHATARMFGGPPVDGRMPGLLRDVRRHDHPPERSDEVGAVVTFVSSKRQAPG